MNGSFAGGSALGHGGSAPDGFFASSVDLSFGGGAFIAEVAVNIVFDKHHAGGLPRLVFHRIDDRPIQVLGAEVRPIALLHGHTRVTGFRCGDVAYCTDTNAIPPESMECLQGLNVLLLDCLRTRPHATHFHVEEAVAAARRIGARQTYFTHLCHDLEHDSFRAQLPDGMEPAYDGLDVPLSTS